MAAIAQDMDASVLQGVSLQKINSLAFAFGLGLAVLAATLVAPMYYIDTTLGPTILLKTFTVVILGGVGSLPGTILGGLILGFIDSFGQSLLPGALPALLAFILVILIIIIRPKGILGHD
jgi:branched-chain amino acid transport system permease protein